VPEIAILTDDPGWHGARLREAFALRKVRSRYASLRDCRIEVDRSAAAIVIPGFGHALPDGVFVRGIPGGTLEQVVLRLDVLHALKLAGVPVCNDGRAIERTVDKAMTSFLLARAGVPTPETWVVESRAQALAIVEAACGRGEEIVIKPLFGSQGVGLVRVASAAELPAMEAFDGVHYLQRYVKASDADWHDWRVFVIGGSAVAAMTRRATHWITNVSRGARCETVDLDARDDLRELAERAVRALDMDYAGVDLIRDRDGHLLVVEVNGIPAWKGLQSVSRVNIAQRLADDFLKRCLGRKVLQSAA
jgi:tetrahydromethanopterin:alpha-L-glutamate ligase